jgi:peptidoglycan/xylan/chitin deacetylase (PgdA/CDA1 family)
VIGHVAAAAVALVSTMIDRMKQRSVLALVLLALSVSVARAQTEPLPCPGNPDALGTARTLAVDSAASPRVGRKHFPQTLPLAPKEVVLTFDDGPEPGTTPRILDALKRECVQASFFLLGRSALAHPELVRRERAEGHTVAHHTFAHPLLNRMSPAAAQAEIDRGFAAVDSTLYGSPDRGPRTPFFRFPGFASSPALLDLLERRGIVVFGADLWASDWNRMTPEQELKLVLERIEATRGGIVLFHDTKRQTAAMLPAFLRALRNRGYRVVHVVPAAASAAAAR